MVVEVFLKSLERLFPYLSILRRGALFRKVNRPWTVELPLFAIRFSRMARVVVVIDRISVKGEHQQLNRNSVAGTAVAVIFRERAAVQVLREAGIVLGPIQLEI